MTKQVSFSSAKRLVYLLGNRPEQAGRVSRHHLSVKTDAGQVLVHVDEILLQGFLHLKGNDEYKTTRTQSFTAFRSQAKNSAKVESFLSALGTRQVPQMKTD